MSNTIAHNTAKEVVYALAKKYGFDTNEAWDYSMNIAEVKNAMGETTSPSDASDTGSSSDIVKKIATCKKNIDLWQKKLDDGKVPDAAKQAEKIDKEKKKLEKLEGSVAKSDKPPAKKAEPKDEKKGSDSDSSASNESKIATCKKNIDLWQKKLDDGSVKDAAKQAEKIEKEKKKLQKLEEAEPKEKAPAKEKVAEKEKRIKRFSPVMTSQLKAILAEVDVEITDKLKKEFQQYIEELSDDDFKKDGFAEHMRTFSKTKAPKKEAVAAEPVETVPAVEDSPAADPDEDVDEIVFEGKKYVVGDKTGRVYEAHDSGDVFKGFIGVGAFKTMSR
jgi:uncharacterized protein YlzI (FlbEa/FlbD family)